MEKIKLHTGDSAEILKQYPDNHFDSIVTDPPYGIEFLGKDWDKNTGPIAVWQECLRVLKPGGHILAFSAARTYHRLATNLEDIGFEIRDQIMWIYGSGFPKGQDMGKLIAKREGNLNTNPYIYHEEVEDDRSVKIGKIHNPPKCKECGQYVASPSNTCTKKCNAKFPPKLNEWSGWKTGLKPAHEPIVMARKPFKGSTVDNVIEYGTGAINIDDTRVGTEDVKSWIKADSPHKQYNNIGGEKTDWDTLPPTSNTGRYPSNVIMSEEEGKVLDEQTGIIKSVGGKAKPKEYDATGYKMKPKYDNYDTGAYVNEPPKGASKYFYSPKVSRKERHIGLFESGKEPKPYAGIWGTGNEHSVHTAGDKTSTNSQLAASKSGPGNNHPTVKPVALMKYLVTLVTPKGGKVLDPFNGSGSTGMAVKEFGGEYVGIDLDPNYIEIANKRIKAW